MPPLTGLAVKVTEVPATTGLADALIVTAEVIGLTVMVIELEVAGEPVIQEAFEVRAQVITSLLTGA